MLPVERSGIPHLAKNERDVGHPGLVWGSELQGWATTGSTRSQMRAEEIGRVPHVRTSVRGTKEIFFECFWFDTEEAIAGLRPSFSAHVR
jgi:hypothetical protein